MGFFYQSGKIISENNWKNSNISVIAIEFLALKFDNIISNDKYIKFMFWGLVNKSRVNSRNTGIVGQKSGNFFRGKKWKLRK